MKTKGVDHDNISFQLHHIVKSELLANPTRVIKIANSNLDKWASRYGYKPKWMSEWEQIINNGVSTIIEILDGQDEKSILLRSSSPFAGVISNKDRMKVFREKRKS